MKGIGLYEAKQNAQILGATHYRTYFTDSKHSFIGEKKPEPFSIHFFDNNDQEIGMYSMEMGKLCGMQVFNSPRVWSDFFKKHKNYSEPIDFRTSCVYHKFTKESL